MTTSEMLLAQHQAGARDHSAALWLLSIVEAFLRRVCGTGTHNKADAEVIGSVA
jgi:hypothetical protein